MKIKKAAFGFIDIFMGQGWENWTRIRKIKTPSGTRLKYVSGNLLRRHQLEQIEKMV